MSGKTTKKEYKILGNCRVDIDENKNFTPVINKALELKGYPKNHIIKGINGGNKVRVGFGHDYILSVADKILNLIKNILKSYFKISILFIPSKIAYSPILLYP